MEYVLITPIKDEQHTLPQLKEIVFNQNAKPVIWVIVDNSDKDDSFQIATDLFKDYSWIHVIKLKTFIEKGYSIKNFAEAINEGYEYAKQVCNENDLEYNFIGKTDATPILAENYFDTLLSAMEKDATLAITCGLQQLLRDGKIIDMKPSSKIPLTGFNDIRLYRKEFFESVAGYPLTLAPDAVLLIKAINRGWKVKVVEQTHFIKSRLGASKMGVWQGSKQKGQTMYELGFHPVLMVLNAVIGTYRVPPRYRAIGQIWGYLLSAVRNEKKIADEEVIEYYRKTRLKEVIKAYLRLQGQNH